jgi:uncharacterized protein (TIGR02757 family)
MAKTVVTNPLDLHPNLKAIKELLDRKAQQYSTRAFIERDPVSIPHLFSKKEDIEIAGFFAATIAWGNRRSIIANATRLMQWMDHSPHAFILNHSASDLKPFRKFAHRTFNGTDCLYFVRALRRIYTCHGGLERTFTPAAHADNSLKGRIIHFREIFFELRHPARTEKHISNPAKKSSAKRLCMFLRWMVRKDQVDFGIWKSIKPAELYLPLDVHTGRVSRKLGILKRKQNDWQAVEEVTGMLMRFNPADPVRYDFALFGMGVENEL